MSLNKHALIRYRIIDAKLRSKARPFPAIDDLRSACEDSLFGSDYGDHISRSTIEKDLYAMRNNTELGFFAPIKYSKIDRGYYYTDEDYTIHSIPLKGEDIDAIKFASNTLMSFRESPMFNQFRFAIEKIFDRLNIANDAQDDRLDKLVQFDQVPHYSGQQHLSGLYKAVKDYHQIVIRYKKFGQARGTERLVHPYLLKEYKHRWYLLGKDPKKERLVTFSLDRIEKLELLDADFVMDVHFNPELFFQHSFGITQIDSDPQNVVLEFPAHQKGYLTTQPLHSSQVITEINDDKLVVKLQVYITYELIERVLGYGSNVKVLAPEDLIVQIKNHYQKALQHYS